MGRVKDPAKIFKIAARRSADGAFSGAHVFAVSRDQFCDALTTDEIVDGVPVAAYRQALSR